MGTESSMGRSPLYCPAPRRCGVHSMVHPCVRSLCSSIHEGGEMPAKRSVPPSSGKEPVRIPAITRADDVRAAFLRAFEERGHVHVPSSSLVPRNDPTVLLTTAGMQQMIPFFLGQEQPPSKRLVSVQKSFRTTDIDSVGDDSHLTFFEMLGNFSVGDYFKRDAIAYAWEILTQVYGLPPERLYPTIHPDDDEAARYWQEIGGVPPPRPTPPAHKQWGTPGAPRPLGPAF